MLKVSAFMVSNRFRINTINAMSRIANDPYMALATNRELIFALCSGFDRGDEVLALPLATTLRVLLHDTSNSVSLLTALGIKGNRSFLSTKQITPHEKVQLGLVRRINVGVHDGRGGEAKYWALADERYFPSPSIPAIRLSFDPWWNEVVFTNGVHDLSRRHLVLAVANKDGGAHFDREVEEKYDAFRHTWSGGSTLVGTSCCERRGYDNIPSRPAIRQIAHEVLMSGIHNEDSQSS